MMMSNVSAQPCINIKMRTPDGVMYFTFVDNEHGELERILSSAGKAGSTLSLWVDATCNLLSYLLSKKLVSLNELVVLLSNYNTASISYNTGGVPVRSGIGGLVAAIQQYKQIKTSGQTGTIDLDI